MPSVVPICKRIFKSDNLIPFSRRAFSITSNVPEPTSRSTNGRVAISVTATLSPIGFCDDVTRTSSSFASGEYFKWLLLLLPSTNPISIFLFSKASSICSEFPVNSETFTCGNLTIKSASSGAIRYWAIVVLAPILSSPLNCSVTSSISLASNLYWANISLACFKNISPCGVSEIFPPIRLNNCTLYIFSSS